jgi:hypothetical protein
VEFCEAKLPSPTPRIGPPRPAWSFAKQNSQAQCSALGRIQARLRNKGVIRDCGYT